MNHNIKPWRYYKRISQKYTEIHQDLKQPNFMTQGTRGKKKSKSKVSRKQEITKIRINETETRKIEKAQVGGT